MSEQNKAFEFINNYKELIATIVFFIGGFLWVIGYFATKEEVNKLNDSTLKESKKFQCLLERNIQWLEGEMMSRVYLDELLKTEGEIRQLQPVGAVPASIYQKMIELEQRKQEMEDNIRSARNKKEQAKSALLYRECEK